ncbi:hypothetical protein Syun_017536 [Stephania yunnanensis]|uniref:Uncharacterized protein n=1 Tax=Stephania yunnanensis TaxID=152371 RepID=A0AAP0P3G2_9MAGN
MARLLPLAFPSLNIGVEADVVGDAEKAVDAVVACQSCKYKTIHVVVEGIVSCQRCEADTKTFSTDKNGYFYAELGFKVSNNTLDDPIQSCRVKLYSAPLPSCNQATNIEEGIDGAFLRFDNKRISSKYCEAAIYNAGNLAFRPNQKC